MFGLYRYKVLLIFLYLSLLFLNGCESKEGKPVKNKPEKQEVINGYTLPPKPDPKINNATLLGVDSNDNGVRDDVERFIIIKYKDRHRAVTEMGFQLARAYQKILDNPLNTEENLEALTSAIDCNHYFKFTAKYAKKGDSILVKTSSKAGGLKRRIAQSDLNTLM